MKKIFVVAAMALLTLSASAQKIGRVSFSELVQLMPEADEARATLKLVSKEADEALQDSRSSRAGPRPSRKPRNGS